MKTELTDAQVLLLRANERSGFDTIWDAFYRPIFYFTETLLDDRETAKEITQDTFLKLWDLRSKFSSAAAVKSFLFITAKNACIDFIRSRKVKQKRLKELSYLQTEADDNNALGARIQAELLEEIRNKVEELPERTKEVFKLLFYENKSAREVAEELGIDVDTVYQTRIRAIKLLKAAPFTKWLLIIIYLLHDFFTKK